MLHATGPRSESRPPVGGIVHPDFRAIATRFASLFRRSSAGGGAIAVYHHGELVVDVWAGYRDEEGTQPWERDTMAMSFSTTKGVAATVVHLLADRGLIGYDDTIAKHWPAFAGNGRDTITVRHLLSHQAGMHRIRGLVDEPEELLDDERVTALVAGQRPSPRPGRAPGYHAFTFGWLVAGLARAVTGRSMRELVAEEIAGPLGVDGLHIGATGDLRTRVAQLFPAPPPYVARPETGRVTARVRRLRGFTDALIVDGFHELWRDPAQRILDAQMPAVNGVFDARSLARMYAALAGGGAVNGTRLLSPQVVHEAGRVQRRERDYVLAMPMRWRLGYHQAFMASRAPAWKAFGHYGFGGSGAWADPETQLAVAFVTNRMGSATTPVADIRMVRLSGAVLTAARSRRQRA
jgi:CubicO group peptidase (beta-lactamase class C family)